MTTQTAQMMSQLVRRMEEGYVVTHELFAGEEKPFVCSMVKDGVTQGIGTATSLARAVIDASDSIDEAMEQAPRRTI